MQNPSLIRPTLKTVMAARCTGNHRWFVSEVKGTTADKFVWVIKVCTACDEVRRVIIPLDTNLPIKT